MLGLNYMHLQSITHRDMKPENILLVSDDPDNFDVKIADLGSVCQQIVATREVGHKDPRRLGAYQRRRATRAMKHQGGAARQQKGNEGAAHRADAIGFGERVSPEKFAGGAAVRRATTRSHGSSNRPDRRKDPCRR